MRPDPVVRRWRRRRVDGAGGERPQPRLFHPPLPHLAPHLARLRAADVHSDAVGAHVLGLLVPLEEDRPPGAKEAAVGEAEATGAEETAAEATEVEGRAAEAAEGEEGEVRGR